MNLYKKQPYQLLVWCLMWLMLMTNTACHNTELTDSTHFMLYYSGLTDIGPSMAGQINKPTYIGESPSDFKIIGITCDGQPCTTDCFNIDVETGAISISNTTTLAVGYYNLSIACRSGGKYYEYPDIVQVNIMKAAPDGIVVTPNMIEVQYDDVIAANTDIELPTAQVSTDGNHVTIIKYEIANSAYGDCFKISSTGEISMVKGNPRLMLGTYVISLKLTTLATTEEQGIFENALTVKVQSKPIALAYSPNNGMLEAESEENNFSSSYISAVPVLTGSSENALFSIEKVLPATNKISINEETGEITVNPGHGLAAGASYTISVRVANDYSIFGEVFKDVFTLTTVNFIQPIANFSYTDKEAVQGIAFAVAPDPGFLGDEVKFEFTELPQALNGKLTLAMDGTVSALNGNSIPQGEYLIKVKATNPKSDGANPAIASFILKVIENVNYFTYIRYGNNLGLTPVAGYADQFRVQVNGTYITGIPESDAKVSLFYEIEARIHQASKITIDEMTGKISVTANASSQGGICLVKATAGKGTSSEYSLTVPVFFQYDMPSVVGGDQVTVHYNPFVITVNPRTGGRSATPSISGVSIGNTLFMDYRRTFNYYNFKASHVSGQPSVENTFLRGLWSAYAEMTGGTPNYGSKNPVSYFVNSNTLSNALLYVNDADKTLVVNPNKWMLDSEYANGFFIGQATMSFNSSTINDGTQIFPVIIWFDTNF